MEDASMITTVVFDLGGTLEDIYTSPETAILCGQKLLEFMKLHGIDIVMEAGDFMKTITAKNEEYQKWSNETLRNPSPYELWSGRRLKAFDIDQDLLRAISNDLAYIWESYYYCRKVKPEASTLLEILKNDGYKLGLISNTTCQSHVFHACEEYGIGKYFGTICLSSIAGFRKPHRLLFDVTARNLLALPGECIYVGDTISRDVEGPRKAGYSKCIRIGSTLSSLTDGGQQREDADFIIECLMEIPGILKKLNAR
jgi:putative hydrolase of the HAD superfamily